MGFIKAPPHGKSGECAGAAAWQCRHLVAPRVITRFTTEGDFKTKWSPALGHDNAGQGGCISVENKPGGGPKCVQNERMVSSWSRLEAGEGLSSTFTFYALAEECTCVPTRKICNRLWQLQEIMQESLLPSCCQRRKLMQSIQKRIKSSVFAQ